MRSPAESRALHRSGRPLASNSAPRACCFFAPLASHHPLTAAKLAPLLRALASAALLAAAAVATVDTTPDAAAAGGGLARGWGDALPWTPFADAFGLAQSSSKPIVLVVWKTWCGACKALRPKWAESAAIASHAEDFVFVNVVDDEEPQEDKYKPDGGYIPRILFLDGRTGAVMDDVVNAAGNPKYKYYYTDGESVAASMATVLARRAAATDL